MLRHADLSVTADYIDVTVLEPLDVSSLIEEVPDSRSKAEPSDQLTAFETVLKSAAEGVADPKDYQTMACQVQMDAGGVCGRETVKVLIERGRACVLHDRRHREGPGLLEPSMVDPQGSRLRAWARL